MTHTITQRDDRDFVRWHCRRDKEHLLARTLGITCAVGLTLPVAFWATIRKMHKRALVDFIADNHHRLHNDLDYQAFLNEKRTNRKDEG